VIAKPRRPVNERWYYDTANVPPSLSHHGSSDVNDDLAECRPALVGIQRLDQHGSSDANDDFADCRPTLGGLLLWAAQESPDAHDATMDHSPGASEKTSSDDDDVSPTPPQSKRPRRDDLTIDTVFPVTRRERATLLKEFRRNQRLARTIYKNSLRAMWNAEIHDEKENQSRESGEDLDPEVEAKAYEDYFFAKMLRYDGDLACQLMEFRTTLRITPEYLGGPNPNLIRDRTMALWEGLRRVYFGIAEEPLPRDSLRSSRTRTPDPSSVDAMLFAREVTGFSGELEQVDRVPHDPDDPVVAREIAALRLEIAELEARSRRRSIHPATALPPLPFRREDDDDEPDPSTCATPQSSNHPGASLPGDTSATTPADSSSTAAPPDSTTMTHCHPSPTVYLFLNEFDQLFSSDWSNGEFEEITGIIRAQVNDEKGCDWLIGHGKSGEVCDWSNGELERQTQVESGEGATDRFFQNGERFREQRVSDQPRRNEEQLSDEGTLGLRKAFLTVKTLRRILNAKESIFKYGIFVPRNDKDADSSPEHARWASGRTLEWMRLQDQGTFGRNLDWTRVKKKFPDYLKRDVGHVFFVYDFKYSGEHRVRLVFDGSRQNPSTYTDTYAPTARGESVRLFHIYAVEESWDIAQYDVPQAFLKSVIDCDIFVHPPRNFSEFPGQLLKLNLSLYGAKQSAALWNKMIDGFLQGMGFSPSPMDPCLYKRSDALIILFVDDLRVAATPLVMKGIHDALYERFQITTSDGTRFLGMDTLYDMKKGYLKLHMETYVDSIHERFHRFDVTKGVPFREIVGCLLWVCLNVMGPELLRVKDLARRSNDYTKDDFQAAIKVLDRIYARRKHGIVIVRGGAGSELVPSSSRTPQESLDVGNSTAPGAGTPLDENLGTSTGINELRENALYKVRDEISDIDLKPVILPLNARYSLIVYADASFAVGETMQSVSGLVIYLNGSPLLWASLKQTIVVDSSCSAEFVAASVACKQTIHAENLIGFLGFTCPKPYVMYTDSTACLAIASNTLRLGNVRHLAIRYHLVRCYVTIGEIIMRYCITEEMVADLLTKIVVGAQDARLAVRFYTLCPFGLPYVFEHQ
jgi:hypothetical protein